MTRFLRPPITKIQLFENVLHEEDREAIYQFLRRANWGFGWKTKSDDIYSFFHRHFAGPFKSDHSSGSSSEAQEDCSDELSKNAPLLFGLWKTLNADVLRGHRLVRCYANGAPFGCDGTVHTDSLSQTSFTAIYYPHDSWLPDWAGETVLFSHDQSDIVGAIYPRPNRLALIPGTLPHVARAVSRSCPVMRITLMFKTVIVGAQ